MNKSWQRWTACALIGIAATATAAQDAEDASSSEEIDRRVRQAVTVSRLHGEAMDVLVNAASSENPFVRSNVIEALTQAPGRATPFVQRGLSDPRPVVRFTAVVTAGRLELEHLVPAIEPLLNDSNASVRAAAIYALHTLGREVNLTPLAGYLESDDPSVRANTAMILGLLGDESAAAMLKAKASAPMPRIGAERAAVVRIQFAEAVVKLGDDSALDVLRAGMYSQFGEVRIISVRALGAVGDERMLAAIERMLDQPPVEQQLAAAETLARLGRPKGLQTVLEHSRHEQSIVRSQAAWVLGWFKRSDAALRRLGELLGDSELRVRVAASASVLRQTAPTVKSSPPADAADALSP